MPARRAGVSGLAVALATAGVWLIYAGLNDVAVVGGLREVLKGQKPTSRRQPSTHDFGALGGTQAPVEALQPTGRIVSVPMPIPLAPIRVDQAIAPAVSELVRRAQAQGAVLSGSGYRSAQAQAALRLKNGCPDVYDAPASQCRIPTARPGESMHQRGLAVDFSLNGRLIEDRNSAGFRFLAANAPALGLQNLPSEPWHWSINGK